MTLTRGRNTKTTSQPTAHPCVDVSCGARGRLRPSCGGEDRKLNICCSESAPPNKRRKPMEPTSTSPSCLFETHVNRTSSSSFSIPYPMYIEKAMKPTKMKMLHQPQPQHQQRTDAAAAGKRRSRTSPNPKRKSRKGPSSMMITCYLALAATTTTSPSSIGVEAWSTVSSPVNPLSFRDSEARAAAAFTLRPGLEEYTPTSSKRAATITARWHMSRTTATAATTTTTTPLKKHVRQSAGPFMLLDGRLATTTLPSLISLPLVHRRSEGHSGVTKTPRSSPPTEHYPQQRRGVLGFDVFALESTTSSVSDIDTGFMSENRKGDAQGPPSSSSSSSTFTAALGITWHDTDWKTNLQRNLPRGDDQASSQSSSLPTRSQIDHLKVTELKQLCLERGLSRVSLDAGAYYCVWRCFFRGIHVSDALTTPTTFSFHRLETNPCCKIDYGSGQ